MQSLRPQPTNPPPASSRTEIRALNIGYVPLTDAAPLLVANAKGFFRRCGLTVHLTPAQSWAGLRDKVAFGLLDVAQMLSPMPIAASLGLGGIQTDLVVTATLGRNGNTITIGAALAREIEAAGLAADYPMPATSLCAALSARRAAGRPMPVFAVVFPFSSHNYLLRHWLAAAGIDPEHDIRLIVVPPPLVAEALADGHIDGFCAGEPWGSRAVDLRVGHIVYSTGDIWPNHPEKVLAFTAVLAARDPHRVTLCTAAILAACAWLDDPQNRAEAVHILTDALPSVPKETIALAFNAELQPRPDAEAVPAPALVFQHGGASYPFPAHGVWWLSQMRAWGHVPKDTEDTIIDRIWRPDLWCRAATITADPVPATDIATPPPGGLAP